MAINTNLVHDLILKEGHRVLRNNTAFINALTPQYDGSYAAHGAKEGSDLRIMTPKEYSVRSGKTIDVQDDTEQAVTISRSIQRGVDLKFSSAELTQDISLLSRTKIQPAMATLAAHMDNYALNAAIQEVYQAVTLPTTNLDRTDILNAGVKLDNGAAPRDGQRCVVLNPQGQADVVGDLAGLFQKSDAIASQYNDGEMGTALGFKFKMSQNVSSLTQGAANTSYVVNTAATTTDGGSALSVDTGSGAFVAGDIITVAAVNAVNPLTKVSTGQLQDFVVTAASAGGTVDLALSPTFNLTGPYQNIDALPLTSAVVTTKGTKSVAYPRNIAFHPGFAAFATADLDLPMGAVYGKRVVEDGISMRLIADYDIKNDDTYYRFDVLFGYKTIIPRWACWIYGV